MKTPSVALSAVVVMAIVMASCSTEEGGNASEDDRAAPAETASATDAPKSTAPPSTAAPTTAVPTTAAPQPGSFITASQAALATSCIEDWQALRTASSYLTERVRELGDQCTEAMESIDISTRQDSDPIALLQVAIIVASIGSVAAKAALFDHLRGCEIGARCSVPSDELGDFLTLRNTESSGIPPEFRQDAGSSIPTLGDVPGLIIVD